MEYYKRGLKHAFTVLVKRGLLESKSRKSSTSNSVIAAKLHSLLAAHYIAEGMAVGPGEKKKATEFLNEATDCLNEAEKRNSGTIEEINLRKGTLWSHSRYFLINLGLLLLTKNMIEPAGIIFKFVLEKAPGNLPGQLGQACFHFLSNNFRSALQGFQTILKNHPEFNEIRLAIGYCFQRLGFKEMAQKAFQRVLQVDPNNESALLALGFLQLDSSKSPQDIQTGLLQMKKVFELDRSNSVAQIHLANHFFFKKDLQKSKTLAEGALNNAPNDKIKTEAYFILAKISHVNENFSDALGNYQLASKLSPDFLPAIFGLAQCFLARGDLEGASMLFERILETEPNCPEVLRLLSFINSSKIAKQPNDSGLIEKTLNYLKKSLKSYPDDYLLLQCAAVFYELIDPVKAVELYTKSKANESDNFSVLNNFVVLKQSAGLIDLSDRELMKKSQSSTNDPLLKTFVKFNEARLLEEFKDEISKAEELYKEIIMENPNFSLAHLRLGVICFGRNQFAEAADHFKDVLGSDEQNRDAWNCVAATHLKQKAFTPARKSFERVLQTIDKNDPYALVSLGNIYIELARQDKSNKHTDEYHRRAGEFYGKALSIDRGNLYAAQGLGLIFADRNVSTEAREVFTQVRAGDPNFNSNNIPSDSTLNLAHSLTELENYPAAINLYSSVIESIAYSSLSSAKKVSLLLYLCRARYLLALDSSDYKAADLAIKDTRTALQLLPNDDPLKFNLALLLQARAQSIRLSKDDSITPELLDSAIESVKEAELIFKNELKKDFDEKLKNLRLSMCSGLIQGIKERSELNEKSVKDQTNRLEQLKLQREAHSQREAEEKAQKEEIERKRLTEIERNRKELVQKMKETDEKVKAASLRSSNSKKSTADDSEGSEEDSGNENDTESRPQRKKRVKTATISDDDLDDITSGRSLRAKRSGSGASSSLLSKEFISSSDEEDLIENEIVEENV